MQLLLALSDWTRSASAPTQPTHRRAQGQLRQVQRQQLFPDVVVAVGAKHPPDRTASCVGEIGRARNVGFTRQIAHKPELRASSGAEAKHVEPSG